MSSVATPSAPSSRPLIAASRPFATERRARSWWAVGSTLGTLVAVLAVAAAAPWWPLRLAASLLGALLMVRGFILFHDFMHGAILRGSAAAKLLLSAYGCLLLAPPRSWAASHNHHHATVGKLPSSTIGAFAILTTDAWQVASLWERFEYRAVRAPLTIAAAYVTVFLAMITVVPLVTHPRRHWDSAVALVLHGGVVAGLWWLGGPSAAIFGFMLPFAVASAIGAYLFYAQHNFVGMRILPAAEWTLERAAVESCSFLEVGRVMRWFTGDIGYHHVHHLNSRIPFYRLAEAMAAIPELQHPVTITLRPRDILTSLRLKLWDNQAQAMVGYP